MVIGDLFARVAVVTGGGSGIGRAVCKILCRDGAKIIAADCNIEAARETVKNLGADSHAIKMDVSSDQSVAQSLTDVIDIYKRPPTIVVNCAGILRDGYLLKMSESQFDEVYRVNLKGTFLVTQHFATAMVNYKLCGSIINVSSIISKFNTIGQCNYAASKSGVSSLTQVASKEFGKFNIRVNAVLPGYIETDMTKNIPNEAKQLAIERCPMKRMGKAEEIGEVVSFLASDRSSFVNGSLLEVTGGLY